MWGGQFHLEQAKARSVRRLREGRARPIDTLARNLHLVDEFGVEFLEPTAVFQGLTLADLQQLKEDALQYQVGPALPVQDAQASSLVGLHCLLRRPCSIRWACIA